MSQVVELRLWRAERVTPALARTVVGRAALRGVPGLRFVKVLGTGSGRSFTPGDADPHHWALLTVADDEHAARRVAEHRWTRGWDDAAAESLRVRMHPLATRGRWSGAEPFRPAADEAVGSWSGPVAAITRARLRPTRALSFWRAVPPVVADLERAPGLRLAVGVGEAPVGLQGTFSLWASSARLVDFAYRSEAHRAAVRRTDPARWYAEELFARLAVDDVVGTYRGDRP